MPAVNNHCKAFENLRGVHTLSMCDCCQSTISDKAFEHLRGVHTLDMYCSQSTITDAAFANLRGIYSLSMLQCSQDTITLKALEYLEGATHLVSFWGLGTYDDHVRSRVRDTTPDRHTTRSRLTVIQKCVQ